MRGRRMAKFTLCLTIVVNLEYQHSKVTWILLLDFYNMSSMLQDKQSSHFAKPFDVAKSRAPDFATGLLVVTRDVFKMQNPCFGSASYSCKIYTDTLRPR